MAAGFIRCPKDKFKNKALSVTIFRATKHFTYEMWKKEVRSDIKNYKS